MGEALAVEARRPAEPDGQDPGDDQEGVQAIEECVAAGVNINITLLFAIDVYDEADEGVH